jgi:hypothetical protein
MASPEQLPQGGGAKGKMLRNEIRPSGNGAKNVGPNNAREMRDYPGPGTPSNVGQRQAEVRKAFPKVTFKSGL